MNTPAQTSRGFTLVEVMVVMIIVSLFAAAAVAGIRSVTSRQLHNSAETLAVWLAAAADDAQLGSSFRGIARTDDALVAIAPLNGNWYRVAHLDPWQVADHLQLRLKARENQAPSVSVSGDSDLQPFLMLSPMGVIDPVGSIELHDDSQLAIINWTSGEFSIVEELQ
ncbi:prepilin-type N-terminal cleavage/methylation domain-containing protein [Pseudomaricurvus alkylphenolicus]|uniref:prepilin-type N-terminal cleavage/methylation domain-containing protein n=1 Tax=Pseudomaricurvus alkylphenolicus TaxID=1306991 RepID=UPI00141F310D|nr:prepilin-type N-terminal cleavage/methylation domain-containing protein [Pseudomaricurvus alkylphenolicus]NIB41415.1 prepilin-type N-terminal cleavage/methylation domain-containing protein [Pseudomaricurvus alkylphenolicus]